MFEQRKKRQTETLVEKDMDAMLDRGLLDQSGLFGRTKEETRIKQFGKNRIKTKFQFFRTRKCFISCNINTIV